MSDPMTIDDAIQLLHETRAYWTAPILHACAAEFGEELQAMLDREEISEDTYEAVIGKLQEVSAREKGAWAQSLRLQHEVAELMEVFGPENVLICMTRHNPSVDDV